MEQIKRGLTAEILKYVQLYDSSHKVRLITDNLKDILLMLAYS